MTAELGSCAWRCLALMLALLPQHSEMLLLGVVMLHAPLYTLLLVPRGSAPLEPAVPRVRAVLQAW